LGGAAWPVSLADHIDLMREKPRVPETHSRNHNPPFCHGRRNQLAKRHLLIAATPEEFLKHLLSTAIITIALIGAAQAQTPPANNSTPPAVATDNGDSNTAAAPVAGKNSFTESQARKRLQKHGYHQVSSLTLDDSQVWRGTATKGGKKVDVSVDYQGNITAE
jgi:hypothetical protein